MLRQLAGVGRLRRYERRETVGGRARIFIRVRVTVWRVDIAGLIFEWRVGLLTVSLNNAMG